MLFNKFKVTVVSCDSKTYVIHRLQIYALYIKTPARACVCVRMYAFVPDISYVMGTKCPHKDRNNSKCCPYRGFFVPMK